MASSKTKDNAQNIATTPTTISDDSQAPIESCLQTSDICNPMDKISSRALSDLELAVIPGLPMPPTDGAEIDVHRQHVLANGQTAPILLDGEGRVCGRAALLQVLNQLNVTDIKFIKVENPFLARVSDFNASSLSLLDTAGLIKAIHDGQIPGIELPKGGNMNKRISNWLKLHLHHGGHGFSARQVADYLYLASASEVEQEEVKDAKSISAAVKAIKTKKIGASTPKEATDKSSVPAKKDDTKTLVKKASEIEALLSDFLKNQKFLEKSEKEGIATGLEALREALERINSTQNDKEAA